MDVVFLLHHTYGESESETYKLLGVFGSETAARFAIGNYLSLPGFREYVNGFTVSSYTVGELQWTEGFGFDQLDDVEQA